MADTLKPCPLCGSSARVYDDGAGDLDIVPDWIAACDDEDGCGCETAFFDTREEAVAVWNRRAERTCTMAHDAARCVMVCSECDAVIGVHVSGSKGIKAIRYCPNCGCKVVRK